MVVCCPYDIRGSTELKHHPNAHLQAEPAFRLDGLGHITDGALNTQSGVHRPARTVFVRNGRTEQGHDSVTRVLVDRAFEAVYLRRDALKAAVDDVVHHLGIELLGEGGETSHV